MKIGVCASLDKLSLIEELGYDYVEAKFAWLASLSEYENCYRTSFVFRQ